MIFRYSQLFKDNLYNNQQLRLLVFVSFVHGNILCVIQECKEKEILVTPAGKRVNNMRIRKLKVERAITSFKDNPNVRHKLKW